MTIGQGRDGIGYIFSSEQQEFGNQSLLFVIPVIENIRYPLNIISYLESYQFYFPVLLKDRYSELDGEFYFPEIVFSIPETDIKITFSVEDGSFTRQILNLKRSMKYVGNQSQAIVKNYGFIQLMPIDINEMDELYFSHNAIFVGLTPKFSNPQNNLKL